jgi:protein associated with RNAse G/E
MELVLHRPLKRSTPIRFPSTQIDIVLIRIGKPARTFPEGLIDDDGKRLRTLSIPSADDCRSLSEKFHKRRWVKDNRLIHSVAKYYFYREYFSVVEYKDPSESLVGYYCDFVTPLQRQGTTYIVTDLVLDFWIGPDTGLLELDRDEFEEVVESHLLSTDLEIAVRRTSERLKLEWRRGAFPMSYIK